MGLVYYKPITPALRHASVITVDNATRKKPEKKLTHFIKNSAGRNNLGRVTAKHRGGGAKRLYRKIDFIRFDKDGIPAKVTQIEYDPYRTARIALLTYNDGEKRYILLPNGVVLRDVLMSGEKAEIKNGNNLPLRCIPVGMFIHCVEMRLGQGGIIARSAGCKAQIIARDGKKHVQVKLNSGEVYKIDSRCHATIGIVGNAEHQNVSYGNAGRMRYKRRRPSVRGVAMNPIDHPLGGGEGKSSGGRHPSNFKGKREGNTRNPKKDSNKFIVTSRKRRNKK